MKKIISIFTILIFIISNLFLTIIIAEASDNQNLLKFHIINNLTQTNDGNELSEFLSINNINNVKSIGSLSQNNAQFGCWLDSFDNDSYIEWTLSDHITASNNEIKIDLSFIKPFEVDNYTVAL